MTNYVTVNPYTCMKIQVSMQKHILITVTWAKTCNQLKSVYSPLSASSRQKRDPAPLPNLQKKMAAKS